VSGSDLSVDNNLKQDENLNTIEEENVENEEDVDIFSEPNIITAEVIEETPISVEYQSESIINLNSDSDITKEEIIYESKNEIIRKYAIYAFAIFLVLVIIILFFKR
jgi:hypothetical protein